MKSVIFITFTFISFFCKSQSEAEKQNVYTIVEEMPDFHGGQIEKNKFILENLKFPESAIKNETYGKTYLKFTINKDGHISDIVVIKGVPGCPECDEEAKRVLSIMPNWIPGKQGGKPVATYYNQPINFQSKIK